MKFRSFLFGTGLTAACLSYAAPALAQSTGTQVFEDPMTLEAVVVQGSATEASNVALEEAAKARASITAAYLETQQPGQTVFESLNLLPGVTFSNNDAYGSSGGDLNIRGFDGSRISATFDGIPLNDTGNYALYTNQMLDPELITRATVNFGATDVDSPTASATGGTVNYVTKSPEDEMSVSSVFSIGADDDYRRYFVRLDSGEIGPYGTTAYATYSNTSYNYFIEGKSKIDKEQFNAQIFQPIGQNGDYVRLMGHYNKNRNNFTYFYTVSRDEFDDGFKDTIDQYSLNYAINPSDTGNIRMQGKFTLSPKLVLTVDPSVQYVRANGGGSTVLDEDQAWFGGELVDLNGNGILGDQDIRVYSPSNTNTIRYALVSSLIYNMNDDHRFRVAYTFDQGRHRQTGDFSPLDTDGSPLNVFGGVDDYGPAFYFADGSKLQKRDRLSVARLNQLSLEYRGDFMDDKLGLTLGLRLPYFERELDQRCYARKGNGSSTQYCTQETPIPVLDGTGQPTGFVRFPSSATQEYAPPFKADVNYDDVLPNIGLTYRPNDAHQFFASFAETLSAPRTDDLYSGILVSQLDQAQPENSKAYDLGYRYRGDRVTASATVWYNQFSNRIERAADPNDPSVFLSRNVGDVDLQGFEATFGVELMEGLSFFSSAAFTDSEVKSTGKELVKTPDMTLAARLDYEIGAYEFGLQGRYVGDRWSDDNNTSAAPSYTVFNFDAAYDLGNIWESAKTAKVRLNVQNLFDENYLNVISGSNSYYYGAPRTVTMSLETKF
ncbi:TonB-dependent receptor [Hyphomonas sp. WL0036]|uniref:TonB-dependent receptor n=1 Tax=Hyphomonas sediminis TaxID=2866160 RepID=UPI001C822BAB|nr:TonB-dependent receptor [Hyphomonas sediminis]MBY9066556.1 TonB-dependent receptor [Hyphomonas sediminis]